MGVSETCLPGGVKFVWMGPVVAGVVQSMGDHPDTDALGNAELPKRRAGQPGVVGVTAPSRPT